MQRCKLCEKNPVCDSSEDSLCAWCETGEPMARGFHFVFREDFEPTISLIRETTFVAPIANIRRSK